MTLFLLIDCSKSRCKILKCCCAIVFLDIDECTEPVDGCNSNADCTNTPGSFYCTCKTGYVEDGITCVG